MRKIIKNACNPDVNLRYRSASDMISALSILKFNIDWIQKSPFYWTGKEGGRIYSIHLFTNLNLHVVELRKNGRRITDMCREFSDINSAIDFMCNYISSTLFLK